MSRFKMQAGDTPLLTGRVVQSLGGPAFDLSGYAVSLVGPDFQVGGSIISPSAGTYQVQMPSAATAAYVRGEYPFRIVITSGALAYTVIADKFRIGN